MAVSIEDLEKLKQQPSDDVKSQVARKIADSFNNEVMNRAEMSLSIEIFRILTQDSSADVRAVLSESLKDNINLPRDVALRLASDEQEHVAMPILEYSYVLTEEDLVNIVQESKEIGKIVAVAKRDSVSAKLSRAIIGKNTGDAIKTLIGNSGARIEDEDLQKLIDEIDPPKGEDILEAMSSREGLSHQMVLGLIAKSPDDIKNRLIEDYSIPAEVAHDLSQNVQAGYDRTNNKVYKLEEAVEMLYEQNKLDYSVLIRALCNGDLGFFEVSMAKLVGIPVNNARILILDKGSLGFKAIYDSSPLPAEFYNAIKIILGTILELTDYGKMSHDNIKNEIREKIIEEGYDTSVEYMDYFLRIMGGQDDGAGYRANH